MFFFSQFLNKFKPRLKKFKIIRSIDLQEKKRKEKNRVSKFDGLLENINQKNLFSSFSTLKPFLRDTRYIIVSQKKKQVLYKRACCIVREKKQERKIQHLLKIKTSCPEVFDFKNSKNDMHMQYTNLRFVYHLLKSAQDLVYPADFQNTREIGEI